jgi:hypothetical protein
MTKRKPCSYKRSGFYCNLPSVMELNGYSYCHLHDPHRAEVCSKSNQATENREVDRSTVERVACAGISTEALKNGVIKRLIAACEHPSLNRALIYSLLDEIKTP